MANTDANGSGSSTDAKTLDAAETPIGNFVDADSSNAKGEAEGSETPSIVRNVVDESDEQPKAAASPAEGSEVGGGADDKDPKTPKEPDDQDFTDVPFHKHPRFKKLLEQRNAATEDAVRYRNVQSFLDTNGMAAEEAANALTVFAQAKVDPVGAWKAIKPWVQGLLVAAGEVVPNDLQTRVVAGELTREAAMEIGRERARATSLESLQKFQTQQHTRKTQEDLGRSLVSTASDWENDRHLKDPNFAAKMPLMQRELAWIHQQEGKPDAPEGVRDQLNRAYKAVNEHFTPPQSRSAVRRPAVRPVVGGQVAPTRPDKPRTTLEIIRQVAASRAG